MSDMEDDFMCDDEEDYDLVFTSEFTWLAIILELSANREVPTVTLRAC